jgi:hypothetical protein
MHDAHQRNELNSVLLHEKNVALADLESRCIGRVHRVVAHRAAEHPDRVIRAERALDGIFDFESDVGNDVTLGSRAGPFRLRFLNRAFKDHFSLVHKLVERGWNDGGRLDYDERESQARYQEERAKQFHKENPLVG